MSLLLLLLVLLLASTTTALNPPCTPTDNTACVYAPSCEIQALDFYQARAACESQGARLCFAEELARAPKQCTETVPLKHQRAWSLSICVASPGYVGDSTRTLASMGGGKNRCTNAAKMISDNHFLRCCVQPPAPMTKRNILLMIVDDFRPDIHLAYGRKHAVTPFLDACVQDSHTVVFDRMHASYPKCSPSRMSFLTGLSPQTTGLVSRAWMLTKSPDNKTLPEFFREHGYDAENGGKVFHHPQDANLPIWTKTYEPYADQYAFGGNCAQDKEATPVLDEHNKPIKMGATMCATTNELKTIIDFALESKAVAALTRLAKSPDPFLLVVGFYKPHLSWKIHDKYYTQTKDAPLFDSMDWPLLSPQSSFAPFFNDVKDGMYKYFGPSPWSQTPAQRKSTNRLLRASHWAYGAAVTETDERLGTMLERLDALKLADNTLVVIMGDNGYFGGELGLFSKNKLFEIATRVPFMVRVPWAPTFRSGPNPPVLRAHKQAELLDLYRTLAGLTGLDTFVSPSIEGVNQAPYILNVLAGSDTTAEEANSKSFSIVRRCGKFNGMTKVQSECNEEFSDMMWIGFSVRTPDWRYNVWLNAEAGRVEWPGAGELGIVSQELYDHRQDASTLFNYAAEPDGATFHNVETDNVAEANPAVCAALFQAIKARFMK